MRRLLLFTVLALLVGGGTALTMTVDEAVGLFQGSDIMIPYSDEGRVTLDEMVSAFRGALGVPDELDETKEDAVMAFDADAGLIDIINKLSQTYYTLADAFLEGDSEERPTYLRGKHWGLKALRMNPDFTATESTDGFVAAVGVAENVDGLYWAAANWLRASEFNKLEAVFAGVPKRTDAMSLRGLELNETYMNYGSYRALGAFWAGLPKLPGGTYRKNWNRSLGYFCNIVNEPEICAECSDCPDFGEFLPEMNEYFENRLLFVEFWLIQKSQLKDGDHWEEAKRILDSVLAEPIGDKYPLYNAISHEKALEFLEEVEEHL